MMGRRYLVLGATSDIALAYLKAEEWNNDDLIIAHYYSARKELEEFAKNAVCRVTLIKANFLVMDEIDQFCKTLKETEFVPTHILHVSALPLKTKMFRSETWDEYQNQIDIQCRSIFKVLQTVLPAMGQAHFGKIVTLISSCVIGVPPKGLASYTATKYMLLGMLKSIAVEYASKNIQINMISPSTVETKFNLANAMTVAIAAKNNPLKRNANVNEIIPAIKFLFSDYNTYITGVNIPITAGEVF